MRKCGSVVLFMLLLGIGGPLQAQGPGPGNTVLFAQFECNSAELARVDELFEQVAAPTLNRYVAEGRIIAWGWVGTYVGQDYNRGAYVWASNPVALLADYLPEIQGQSQFADFARLCPRQTISIHNAIQMGPMATGDEREQGPNN